MKYLSLCSGIEAASVAWRSLGWKAVGFSEIDRFPSEVLAYHFPGVPNFGDMNNYETWPVQRGAVDLVIGGTPCQSFSVAGLRKGLADPRGNLALVYLGIVDRFRPRWFIWENVPGVLSSNRGRDFGALLGGIQELGYSCAWRVLDAQFWGVPQRRRRVFVVGNIGDWRGPAKVLFDPEGGDRNYPPRGTQGAPASSGFNGGSCFDNETITPINSQVIFRNVDTNPSTRQGVGFGNPGDPAFTLQASHHHAVAICRSVSPAITASGRGFSRCGESRGQDPLVVIKEGYGGNNCSGSIDVATACRAHGGSGHMDFESETFILEKANIPIALSDVRGIDKNEHGKGWNDSGIAYTLDTHGNQGVFQEGVRRLTPLECERLQGFPDNWTLIGRGSKLKPAADGPRYKAIGNSMAVPVIRWLGERIEQVERGDL